MGVSIGKKGNFLNMLTYMNFKNVSIWLFTCFLHQHSSTIAQPRGSGLEDMILMSPRPQAKSHRLDSNEDSQGSHV